MRFGIVVYDDVEPIDIGATYGVLSMARRIEPAIEMFLVAARAGTVRCASGLEVVAHHGFVDCPAADAVIVTGGPGWTPAGLLDGHHATTKREVTGAEIPPIAILREQHPAVHVVTAPVVDEGAIVTGGGVSLAIDLTLHLLERLGGRRLAAETARIIEYATARQANVAAFQALGLRGGGVGAAD